MIIINERTETGNRIICSPRSNRAPTISRDTSALETLCYTSVGYAISWPTSSYTTRCYRQNETNNRISCALLRENHSSPDRSSIHPSIASSPPPLSISPISQSWLLLTLPVTFVCGRIASNVCADFLCVARFNAVLYRFWYRHRRGGGEREERGNNVSFARMVTIADRKPGNSGRRNGRGGKVGRPNKVVFIFMSF